MYVAITCCIMTCSISKGFVTYHGSMECEINVKCEMIYNCAFVGCNKNYSVTSLQDGPRWYFSPFISHVATFLFEHGFDFTKSGCLPSKLNIYLLCS